jgi:hypothetical protein
MNDTGMPDLSHDNNQQHKTLGIFFPLLIAYLKVDNI